MQGEMEESRKRKPLSPVKQNVQAKRPALTGASRPGRVGSLVASTRDASLTALYFLSISSMVCFLQTVAKVTETKAASSAPPPVCLLRVSLSACWQRIQVADAT